MRMWIAIVALNAAAAAAGAAAPASMPAQAGGNAGSIPPNTWVSAQAHYALPKDIPGADWATGDGYAGSTYRSKTGTILFRSGIQSKQAGLSPGFYSNATLEWDLATNQVRVVDVANWGGGSYGGGRILATFKDRPTPTPRHIYDGIAYVESEDAYYLMLGANGRMGPGVDEDSKRQKALDNNATWKYTFADGRWTRIDGNVNQFWKISPYESHMRHWPEGGKLLFLNDGGSCYAEFDLKGQRWDKAELKNNCPMRLYNARSTWDSKRQLWVFRLGPKLCTFDPKTRQFKGLPEPYALADDKDPRRVGKGVVYIPKHDVYLVTGPTGNDTYVYKVEKGTWANIRGGDIELVNGYPQYDPKTDRVGLVYQLKTFKFHYVPQKGE